MAEGTIDLKQIRWPGHGYDLEVAHTLSAAGWVYDPSTAQWTKDGHGISEEGFGELLSGFAAARRRILEAITKGALGFTADVEQNDKWANNEGKDWEFRISIRITWPDAVTRLGKVAKEA